MGQAKFMEDAYSTAASCTQTQRCSSPRRPGRVVSMIGSLHSEPMINFMAPFNVARFPLHLEVTLPGVDTDASGRNYSRSCDPLGDSWVVRRPGRGVAA